MTTIGDMKAIVLLAVYFHMFGCSSIEQDIQAASVDDGCPVGEQPVFSGHGDELECAPVPAWPPPSTGSRDVPAPNCELNDGTYEGSWTTDDPAAMKARPAFTYLKELTIDDDHMIEVDIGYTSTTAPPILALYTYNLDWLNASSANVWGSGDTDTWQWVAWRDCVDGKLYVLRTFNLPYPNPGGPQIESWRFSGSLQSIEGRLPPSELVARSVDIDQDAKDSTGGQRRWDEGTDSSDVE